MNPATGRFMSMDPQQHDPITPLLPVLYHSLRLARKPLDPIRWAGWPTSEIRVPHLRDGCIVAKVGYGS
jgi:hypothetical protein